MSYVEKEKPGMPEMTVIMVAGTLALILFAYLVLIYIDAPVRKALKNRMSLRMARSAAAKI